ncbi:MAG: hypothetical protein JRJ43_10815 [Deltaproteobacteria bacterium]|nr:hypothetical protein [Deltaproteobacteria bacterium]
MTLVVGCTTGFREKLHIPDPWKEATQLLRDGRVDEAISNLKSLLNDPDYSCRAAFYLFAFDGAQDEYIRIIRSETCEYKTPGEAKLVEKLLTTEKKLLQLKSEYNKQQSSVSALRKETENLEKELSRLRFELQKMEEIRRETEKWRIQ